MEFKAPEAREAAKTVMRRRAERGGGADAVVTEQKNDL
jgi:hypothetical protein